MNSKTLIFLIIVVVIIAIVLVYLFLNPTLGLISQNKYKEIPCRSVDECKTFLLNKNVPLDKVNLVQFVCDGTNYCKYLDTTATKGEWLKP